MAIPATDIAVGPQTPPTGRLVRTTAAHGTGAEPAGPRDHREGSARVPVVLVTARVRELTRADFVLVR